jgi:hypothetical protein
VRHTAVRGRVPEAPLPLPPEALPERECERAWQPRNDCGRDMAPRDDTESERAHDVARRLDSTGRGLETAPHEGATERQRKPTSPQRGMPLLGAPTTLDARGTCKPQEEPPGEAAFKSRRPFRARKANVAGVVDRPASPT